MIQFMTKAVCIAFGVLLSGSTMVHGDSAPEVPIADGPIQARIYLPVVNGGFYRGTRFDWSGVIGSLKYGGHDYYPQWFERSDPNVHDFIYDGADIVAGPCTAAVGPAEEFAMPLGFDEAKASGTFVKIGVGVLRKLDDKKYDIFRLYPIADGGKWTVTPKPDSIEFRHELADFSGYAYEYRKKSTCRREASPNKINFDRHSSFTDRCHRSKFAFKLGLRGGSLIALIPTASRIPANAMQNFASRSCNRYRQPLRKPTSAKLMFRAICSIQRRSGDVVIPAIHILRLATRMNVST